MDIYNPCPINTDDVAIPEELSSLLEKIAENVHEVWSFNRMKEGWSYGLQRDDETKKHPCLIPYSQLSENEKEYDRATAMETLKLILKLGFRILPPE